LEVGIVAAFSFEFVSCMTARFGFGIGDILYPILFIAFYKVGRSFLSESDTLLFALSGMFFASEFWELPIYFRQMFPSAASRWDYVSTPAAENIAHIGNSLLRSFPDLLLIFPFLHLLRPKPSKIYVPSKKWVAVFASYLACGIVIIFPVYNYFLIPNKIAFSIGTFNFSCHELIFLSFRIIVCVLLMFMALSAKGIPFSIIFRRNSLMYEKVAKELSRLKVITVKQHFDGGNSDNSIILVHDWDGRRNPRAMWKIENKYGIRSTFFVFKKNLLRELDFFKIIQSNGWEVGLHCENGENLEKDIELFKSRGIELYSFSTHGYPVCPLIIAKGRELHQCWDAKADIYINDNGGEICCATFPDFTHKVGKKMSLEEFLRLLAGFGKERVLLDLHVDWWE
jgi:hypothetical protein